MNYKEFERIACQVMKEEFEEQDNRRKDLARAERIRRKLFKVRDGYQTLKARDAAKKRMKPIAMMKDGVIIKSFQSVKEASTYLGLHSTTITHGLKKRINAGGYKWKYLDDC